MTMTEKSIVSFCRVVQDPQKKLRLQRLADLKKGVELVRFTPNSNEPRTYSNRDLLFVDENARLDVGDFGFWQWSAGTNQTNPGADYIQSHSIQHETPIQVIAVPNAKTIEDAVDALRQGLKERLISKRVLCAPRKLYNKTTPFAAIYCDENALRQQDGRVRLADNLVKVHTVIISARDVLHLGDEEDTRVYKSMSPPRFTQTIFLMPRERIVCKAILENFSWQTARSLGLSDANWRATREFIATTNRPSLTARIAQECECDEQEATQELNAFLDDADGYFQKNNEEAQIRQYLETSANFRQQCYNACYDDVKEIWLHDHEADVAQAQEELKMLKQEAETIRQENAATKRATSEGQATPRAFKYYQGKVPETQETDEISDVKSFVHTLEDNLRYSCGVAKDYCQPFAAFLIAALATKTPILLVGANGVEIFDALSVTRYGKLTDQIDCNQPFSRLVKTALDRPDTVSVIRNPFQNEWRDKFPQLLTQRHNAYVGAVYPYVEDMLIEPSSLYNYVAPVVLDLFLDSIAEPDFVKGDVKEGANLEKLGDQKVEDKLKRFLESAKLPTLYQARITNLLNEFSAIYHRVVSQTSEDYLSYFYAFAIFPFYYLTGAADLNKKLLASSKINEAVKERVRDYIGGEND